MINMERDFSGYGLDGDLLRALQLLGMERPTAVQQQVIPLALEGKDLMVQAETGSGKTAAFAVPLCQLVDWEENAPQGLILVPTRELALQVQQEIMDIGKFKRIKAPVLYGMHSFHQQARDLQQKSHLVVATPGRALDHLQRGTLDPDQMRYLVIDEADELLHLGFLAQVEELIGYLPLDRVTLLFSATMPPEVAALGQQYMHNALQVTVDKGASVPAAINHYYYDATEWDKLDFLQGILMVRNPDSCIIFANTREQVEELYQVLYDDGYSCARLHGGMEQRDRTDVMADFRRGAFRYLVATDVAARGIDIAKIGLVVNYELPNREESYIHRVGRTGRAGNQGTAISLVEQHQLSYLQKLSRLSQAEIMLLPEPTLEEVEAAEEAFRAKMDQPVTAKQAKNAVLHQDILKLQICDGKKAKIRPVDIVGTICAIPGIEAKDIGVINIMDWSSYVEILNGKGELVLEALQTKPIKAQVRRVIPAKY